MEEGAAFPLAFPVLLITLPRGEMVKILPPLLPHTCFLPRSKGPEAISMTASSWQTWPALGCYQLLLAQGRCRSKAFEV